MELFIYIGGYALVAFLVYYLGMAFVFAITIKDYGLTYSMLQRQNILDYVDPNQQVYVIFAALLWPATIIGGVPLVLVMFGVWYVGIYIHKLAAYTSVFLVDAFTSMSLRKGGRED